MRSSYNRFLRLSATVTLFFFAWTFAGLKETVFAAQNGLAGREGRQDAQAAKEKRAEEKLDQAVKEIENLAKTIAGKDEGERREIKSLLQAKRLEFEGLDKEVDNAFLATETHLKTKGMAADLIGRHQEVVREYRDNAEAFKARLDALEKAASPDEQDQAAAELQQFLDQNRKIKKRPKIDFNNLPQRAAEPTKAQPRLKKEEFKPVQQAQLPADEGFALFYPGGSLSETGYHPEPRQNPAPVAALTPKPVQVASIGSLSGLIAPLPASIKPDVFRQTAADGDVQILLAGLTDLPKPDDLTQTIDVQLTPAIRAKAAELGNDPLKIYEWVRNNVEFSPTWGSIQGADYCLQTKECNAFDTSSLLIALLRAADIPARYVQGTAEMDTEKFMNWVGDFTDVNAALTFARSGGIPLTGMVMGGKIARVQFEHVWVEAWIDYNPSRGARHQTGKGDTWIALDGAYKQHTYTQPMDIAAAVPFDAQTFADQIVATATINQEQGYVTGVDQAYIEQTMTDFQSRVQSYISTNYPNATVGDVLGAKTIKAEVFPYLLGTLPYKTVVAGSKTSELPAELRHGFSLSIDGVAPISYSASLPELAGKKITLSYSPATSADEALINSYLPAPHEDGTPITPEELPSSLPAYLINLKPELRIDGQVVASGGAVVMGTTEDCYLTLTFPGNGTFPIHNTIEAGDYAGIALDPGRISQGQLEGVKTKLADTKARLEVQNFSGLTKDDLLGDLLYSTALAYYAEYDVMDHLAARTMKVNNIRLPSEALFANDLKFTYSYFSGRAISAEPGGLVMDVDANTVVVQARDGSKETYLNFMRSTGLSSSALEHSVPEQLFSTPDNPAQGVSAVKALQIANSHGIPIYTINQANITTILPQLQVDENTINDITNAVAYAGKVVTVSKSNITFNGWTGCGFIVFDPDTGAGAYMISGGLNGAWVSTKIDSLSNLITQMTIEIADMIANSYEVLKGATTPPPLNKRIELASAYTEWYVAQSGIREAFNAHPYHPLLWEKSAIWIFTFPVIYPISKDEIIFYEPWGHSFVGSH